MTFKSVQFFTALALISTVGVTSQAQETVQMQNRVNLEDVKIQGEANRNQELLLNRNKFGLDDRVKIRHDFKKEMAESIPKSFGKLPDKIIVGDPAGSAAPQ